MPFRTYGVLVNCQDTEIIKLGTYKNFIAYSASALKLLHSVLSLFEALIRTFS